MGSDWLTINFNCQLISKVARCDVQDLFLSYQCKNKEESQVCLCINKANKFIKIVVIFL